MKRYVGLVVLMIFCMIFYGLGCKRTDEGQQGKIEGKSKTTTAESFGDVVNEEVEKIPHPAEEWGGAEEEPFAE